LAPHLHVKIHQHERLLRQQALSLISQIISKVDESLSTSKEQLHNHQLALQTAERIIEQYQQENQKLIEQIN
jgi:hypothetical protein